MSNELRLRSHRELSGFEQGSACFEYQVWDVHNRLVYVGIADSFTHRWTQHRRSSWWLGEVEIAYVDVTGWPSREAARMSEAVVINTQSPVYNTALEEGAYRRALAADESNSWPPPCDRSIYVLEAAA